jgi:hypothetical protein
MKMTDTATVFPTKQFFVGMLTRDIKLSDAIFDLLDNCVDGLLRTVTHLNSKNPYQGFWASINFKEGKFTISDNCGGIPIERAEKDAFAMGNPKHENHLPTLGMYGIGMKRAIFKLGRSARVISQTSEAAFEVNLSKYWPDNDKDWNLLLTPINKPFEQAGTLIEVDDLHETRETFEFQELFLDELRRLIASHYTNFIAKGFKIMVAGKPIERKPLTLLFNPRFKKTSQKIMPYIYKGEINGVKVRLIVGLIGPTPTDDELEEELDLPRNRGEEAGWTIICNDRVVVYGDKTPLTGWGEENVPRYHSQFSTISGIVEFESLDSMKLPLTTTKSLNPSSDIYRLVKSMMREGTRIFTNFTNKWKAYREEEPALYKKLQKTEIGKIISKIPESDFILVRGHQWEKKYLPDLPKPNPENPKRQVKFAAMQLEIRRLAEFLFEDKETPVSEVGIECFNRVLREIKQ